MTRTFIPWSEVKKKERKERKKRMKQSKSSKCCVPLAMGHDYRRCIRDPFGRCVDILGRKCVCGNVRGCCTCGSSSAASSSAASSCPSVPRVPTIRPTPSMIIVDPRTGMPLAAPPGTPLDRPLIVVAAPSGIINTLVGNSCVPGLDDPLCGCKRDVLTAAKRRKRKQRRH